MPLPGGGVMVIELAIGESRLDLASEFPDAGVLSPARVGGTSTVLQIQTEDADALWARALEAGAEVRHELADQFWGERHGQLVDPFRHRWNVASTYATSRPRSSPRAPRRHSGAAKAEAVDPIGAARYRSPT